MREDIVAVECSRWASDVGPVCVRQNCQDELNWSFVSKRDIPQILGSDARGS